MRTTVVLLLFMAGAQAIYWLITPTAHPDAGNARHLAVALQGLAGVGCGTWLLWRMRAAPTGPS